MNREPLFRRKTSISYKTEEKTVMRGYNLSDFAEEGYSFCDALFVLFQNRIPTGPEEKMLKYEMDVFRLNKGSLFIYSSPLKNVLMLKISIRLTILS